jgi:hypothetical protein
LDPAVGDGALLEALLWELSRAGIEVSEVAGFDVDREALEVARHRLGAALEGEGEDAGTGKRSGECTLNLRCADFLEAELGEERPFDLIIANPPYVRTQVLGRERARALASRHALRGRLDLYQVFAAILPAWLREGGAVAMITSNRFLSTRSGRDLRRRLLESLEMAGLWDLGDTRLFEAAVLPAVVVGIRARSPENQGVPFCSIYSTDQEGDRECESVFDALGQPGAARLTDGRRFWVEQGELRVGPKEDGVWAPTSLASLEWLERVAQHRWKRFGEVGEVRVGIKSTADAVFISDAWPPPGDEGRPEWLRPLVTHHCARRYRARATQHEVLYTHRWGAGGREVIPLEDGPRARAHLEKHESRLSGRRYVQDAGRRWYELWVPQDPRAWAQPKMVFRDIVDRPTFWVDRSGAVVNGDCYWMRLREGEDSDLLWLAVAVANSTFIECFYDRAFHNKLYAGRRRFMTQYVENFPLPDPTSAEARSIIEIARSIYEGLGNPAESIATDLEAREAELDRLVWGTFGLVPPLTADP